METSLYFHIPFCTRRCGYCDFITFSGFERLIPDYVSALQQQVTQVGKGEDVHTIYFGGGTPSLVPASEYRKLFSTIRNQFNVLEHCEISLEANPGTVNKQTLSDLLEAGFNRVSFGMQSAMEKELELLDRTHTPGDVELAVRNARIAGFENINLDLIFGLPSQSLTNWKYSLEKAFKFKPEHLSLYSLIVEDGTPLFTSIANGKISMPNEDIAAEQYEWACGRLDKAGFEHYEISNWAKIDKNRDYRCQHNLQYWRLLPYFGFGTGAVGFIPADPLRNISARTMTNAGLIGKFIHHVNQNQETNTPEKYFQSVSEKFEKETFMFVGFRLLVEGISLSDYYRRFNTYPGDDFGEILSALIERGLVEKNDIRWLRLTKKGWLLANRVFREFSSVEE